MEVSSTKVVVWGTPLTRITAPSRNPLPANILTSKPKLDSTGSSGMPLTHISHRKTCLGRWCAYFARTAKRCQQGKRVINR